MIRKRHGGLIQCRDADQRPACRIDKIQPGVARRSTFRSSRRPGKQGVQILCLQEIFNGPYFCPSQDPRWYDVGRIGARSDDRADGRRTRRSTRWRSSCRSTSASRPASTTTPRRSIDADGTYLGKYRKNHIPHTSGFWEKYFFKPGNLGYPVFQTRYAQDRRLHLLRPPLPRGRAPARPERRRDRLQPVGDRRWPVAVPLEARAAGARRRERLLHGAAVNRVGTEAPWNIGKFYGIVLLRRSARQLPRRRAREDKDELVVADDGPRHDRGGAPRLAVLSRPPSRDVRRDGGAAAVSLPV